MDTQIASVLHFKKHREEECVLVKSIICIIFSNALAGAHTFQMKFR